MSSSAHIVIPTTIAAEPKSRAFQDAVLTSDSPREDVSAVFDGIDEALASCRGASYEVRMTVLISACIERGINTRQKIRGAAKRKNFNIEKVSKFLTQETGKLWRRDRDDTYTLIG